MTARILALPIISCVFFSISGFVAPEETPRIITPALELRTLTIPKEELLIGAWKMIKEGDKPLQMSEEAIAECRKDGTIILTYLDVSRMRQEREIGKYHIEGIAFSFMIPPTGGSTGREYQGKIELLTEDQLILVGGRRDQTPGRSVLKRIPDNK
jgi:hypothetical protein